jgi:hypothetical protein
VDERILDHHAGTWPLCFVPNQLGGSQALDEGAEVVRVGRQIEEAVAGLIPPRFQPLQLPGQPPHALASREVGPVDGGRQVVRVANKLPKLVP